jgi:hypothetical protein
MVDHLEAIFTAPSTEAAAAIARSSVTDQLWFNMTVMRQGAFTALRALRAGVPGR